MPLAKTFLALAYLAIKSIYKYFFHASPQTSLSQTDASLSSIGGEIEKKMNSTTDDEAYSSSSSSLASTSYFSQSTLLNVSQAPSSILPIVNHEEEVEEEEDHEVLIKKDLSLRVEDLYERLQGRTCDVKCDAANILSNEYIQNIIKTSILKYTIKKSIKSTSFKYFNEVSLKSQKINNYSHYI
jgi:hypothetical protein